MGASKISLYLPAILLTVLLVTISSAFGIASSADLKGIIVEQVAKDSGGQQAGLQEGDIIIGWTQDTAKGSVDSPFDLLSVEIEEAPRGTVILEGFRNSKPHTWTLGQSDWNVTAIPRLPDSIATEFREGKELLKERRLSEAAARWQSAVTDTQESCPPWLAASLSFLIAQMWVDASQWEAADHFFQEAINTAKQSGPMVRAELLHAWGLSFQRRGDWDTAGKYYEQELAEARHSGSDTLTVASVFSMLAGIAGHHGDVQKAEQLNREALVIRQKLAPGSHVVAKSLGNLGLLALGHGDLDSAEKYFHDALAIKQSVVPNTLSLALAFTSLGNLMQKRGDLNEAERYHRQALAIQQSLDPGGMQVALSLNNLGIIASLRGDLAEAEELFLQALPIKEKYSADTTYLAATLGNLGSVAYSRGSLVTSEAYHRKSLAIYQKVAPNSGDTALELFALGLVAHDRHDPENAERYYQQALAIQLRLAPTSPDAESTFEALGELALGRSDYQATDSYFRKALEICGKDFPQGLEKSEVLSGLGALAQKRGEWESAQGYYNKALAVAEKVAPHSPSTASALHGLGSISRARADLVNAETYYRRALAIEDKLAPGSAGRAESLHELATIMRDRKQPAEAGQFFEQSLNALENQIKNLGGTEDVHLAYRACYAAYYQDYIDFLMSEDRHDLAFQVAERWRARSLLNMLAEARIDIRKGVDPILLNQERSLRERLGVKFNQQIDLFSHAHTDQQAVSIQREIEELSSKYRETEGLIRGGSPEYAALTQPQPLTLEETRELLNEDTLLLEYVIGEKRSYLWAGTSDSFAAYRLPKRAQIEPLIKRLYDLLSTNNSSEGLRVEADRAVSRILLGPVAEQLGNKRLLIVADGALQYLPFGALLQPEAATDNVKVSTRVPRVLILDHEIVSLPSASTLAVLRHVINNRPPAPKAVAVLADPVFRKDDPRIHLQPQRSSTEHAPTTHADNVVAANEVERSGREAGVLVFDRLSWSRKEADGILGFTHEGEALRAVDFRASRATAISPELGMFRIVHLASHALLNVQHPDLSGVVLSLVDEEGQSQDGFLRLQDIYNLKLGADLVVLSACRTALGKEVKGEGLLGLTRGFMYAGAPRVVASLWKVPDKATAELMTEFYKGMLADGLRPASALRAAQIAISKEKAWADPYYWAAFILQGEWQ